MLTDTHTHLYWDSFKEDFDQVVQRAIDSGVTQIINVGVDVKTSKLALEQVENILTKFPKLQAYSSIGIHPHEASKYISNSDVSIQKDIDRLEEIYLSNPQKVMAVGECGLDYFVRDQQKSFAHVFEGNPDFKPSSLSIDQLKELQKKLLTTQVNLAKKLNLPLLIHCRNSNSPTPSPSAWEDIWEIIKDHFGILHCYSGDLETTKKALNSNYLFSFPATITYPKNEALRELAKTLPLKKIVLETDCPFLPSQQNRGKRNEPSTIKEIAELIADLRGFSIEEVAKQTTENSKKLFKL